LYTIGLTGGIGSGKSAVAHLFRRLGVSVIDADQSARRVVARGMPALQRIAEHFGSDILLADGELDRRQLRQLVFSNPDDRRWLEQLTHPLIRQDIEMQISAATGPYVILESPLLLETSQHQDVQRVLVVDVPESLQIARACRRDDTSEAQIRAIIDSQISRRKRLARADDVIDNSGSLESLSKQVTALHRFYVELARQREQDNAEAGERPAPASKGRITRVKGTARRFSTLKRSDK